MVGFSVTLLDLITHLFLHPWSQYVLAFPPLLTWSIYRQSGHVRSFVRLGLLGIGLSLFLQMVAAKADVLPAARPLLVLVAISFLLMRGIASLRFALLSLWFVPIPHVLVSALGGAAAASFLFEISVEVLSMLGVDATVQQGVVTSGDHQLRLASIYGGHVALVNMLGLGWFYTMRHCLDTLTTLRVLVVFSLLALPIQFAVNFCAVVSLSFVGSLSASVVLNSLSWLVPFAVVVWFSEIRQPSTVVASD